MDLFAKFKKDYLNYLISIILPALFTGLSIPVFKNLLGAKGYGKYAIYMNAVLIGNAILTGWITQSIIRFYPQENNKELFTKTVFSFAVKLQMMFLAPIIFAGWYFTGSILLSVILFTSLFTISMQFCMLSFAQAGFLSKKTIFSESIRVLVFLGAAILILSFTPVNYIYALFISTILGYLCSSVYLYKKVTSSLSSEHNIATRSYKGLLQKIINYGAPLSLWFVIAYLISYVDKIFIVHNLGSEIQGNYQALFDLISKAITIILSPVLIALLPLVVKAHETGRKTDVKKLLLKIIFFEAAGFILTATGYWFFGSDVLQRILKIPATPVFKQAGLLIIAGTFVWQIAMVAHKRFELKFQSTYLLYMMLSALIVQLILYGFFVKKSGILIYPIGYLAASGTYLFLVAFSTNLVYLKKAINTGRAYLSKYQIFKP
ncbi:hypothetical protein BH09BAC2_BH09BAC2_02900 [soil metagenome]